MRKVKANTIIEVLIAFILISIAFGAFGVTIMRTYDTSRLSTKFKARLAIHEIRYATDLSNDYFDNLYKKEQLSVKREITSLDDTIKIVTLTALDSTGRKLVEERYLVRAIP